MSTTDEIKRMRQEGISDQEIMQLLRQKGISQKEIENALTQAQIKEAITANPQAQYQETGMTGYQQSFPIAQEQESQQEIQAPSPGQYQQAPEQYQEQYPKQYEQQGYDYQYPQYAQTQISSDTINEIAEQVMSEKLLKIRSQIEKLGDLKTMAETKLFGMDERLKRIEKIIDTLQLSILQKIGQYASGVSDLKKELIETQKSFSSLSRKHHHTAEHSEHKHSHAHHEHK